jgi:hypothetical protein
MKPASAGFFFARSKQIPKALDPGQHPLEKSADHIALEDERIRASQSPRERGCSEEER